MTCIISKCMRTNFAEIWRDILMFTHVYSCMSIHVFTYLFIHVCSYSTIVIPYRYQVVVFTMFTQLQKMVINIWSYIMPLLTLQQRCQTFSSIALFAFRHYTLLLYQLCQNDYRSSNI